MIVRSEIELSYRNQQEDLLKGISGTERSYLNKFTTHGGHIEVISGIRRCGKSTLMKQLMFQYKKNIAYFNFEDPRVFGFEVSDFQKLDEIMGRNKSAYFFDEIQNVNKWEIFARQLHDRGEKVFITGSNASLLSKELGTRLTGRHLHHELFPFSFNEFLAYKKLKKNHLNFVRYSEQGGFPEFLRDENPEILQSLLKDIVLRDIAIRYGIRNSNILLNIALYLVSNVGKECTYNSLRKIFSVGSTNSIVDYLNWLEDTYLLFFLPRFSWSAKSISINPRKVYAIDNGLINVNSMSFSHDRGRLLENLIYLYLRQNKETLYYFKEKGECDFVVFEKNKCKMVIQVCDEINGDNQNREINGVVEAAKFFKLKEATVITKNQTDTLLVDKINIRIVKAYDFITE